MAAEATTTATTQHRSRRQARRHADLSRRRDVDYLDPGQAYYTFGYIVPYSTNRTLYSFKPGDSVKPVPDLAEGPPEISDGPRPSRST